MHELSKLFVQLFVQRFFFAVLVARINLDSATEGLIRATIRAKKCMNALTRQVFYLASPVRRPIVVQCDVHEDVICAAG